MSWVEARFVGTVGLGARAFSDANIGVRIPWSDETHVVETIDGDDVVALVGEAVNGWNSDNGGGEGHKGEQVGCVHIELVAGGWDEAKGG